MMLWKGVLGRWGVSDVLENVCVRLPRYGVEPLIVCDSTETESFSLRTGIPALRAQMLPGWLKPVRQIEAAKVLLEIARKKHVNLCHAHAVSSPARSALMLKNRLGIPFVLTSHGELTPAYRSREKWSRTRLARAKRALFLADAVTHLNDRMQSYALELSELKGDNLVIPNGCDVKWWRGALPAEAVKPSRPYFLALGRLTALKGPDALIRAERKVLDSGLDVSLAFAGTGEEEENLKKLARSLEIPVYEGPEYLAAAGKPGVIFCGFVEGDAKRVLVRNSALIAHPNKVTEAFGIVLVEAMAAGKPFVCYGLPTFEGIAADGVTGRVVSPVGDEEEFAKAVISLLEDPAKRESIGMGNFAEASKYDWDDITEQYAKLYLKLASMK